MTNVSTIRYNERKNGVHKSQLVLSIPSGGRAVYLVDKPLSVNVISFLSFTIIPQYSCVCKGIFLFWELFGNGKLFFVALAAHEPDITTPLPQNPPARSAPQNILS